jgi:hypothetical protein
MSNEQLLVLVHGSNSSEQATAMLIEIPTNIVARAHPRRTMAVLLGRARIIAFTTS